ncbi:MAG: G1 family glutamic endopeptidase, partial [Acidimicrobiales bacterium]
MPFRLVDTRAGSGYFGEGHTLGPGTTFTFPVAGEDNVPGTATAAALNVTVTGTTSSSYLSLFPAGGTRPLVSNLNWPAGDTVPNLVMVPLSSSGEVSAYNLSGDADLVVDLEGYFAPEPGATTQGSYGALTPARLLDTRTDRETLGANGTLNLPVSGQGGLPSAGDIDAVLLNVTVTDTSAPSYLTVYPKGNSRPTASNLNWVGGQTRANRVVVPLGSSGDVTIYNLTGQADVVVDVDGYFTAGGSAPANAGLYTPVTPVRAIDTRSRSGEPGAGDTLGPGGVGSDKLSWIGSLGSNVTAVVSNVTTTDTTSPSYLTVYPGPTKPLASDLNWLGGQTVANLTVATVGSDGVVYFYNFEGDAELVVDIFGYFSSTATLESSAAFSDNWSGYVEQSGPQTAVSGTFTVPTLYQGQTGTYMAEWVGID